MVNFMAIAGGIHTLGIFFMTIGILKQFNFSVTETLFGFLLTPEQAGGLLALGVLFTAMAFWVQTLIPTIRQGKISKFLKRVF